MSLERQARFPTGSLNLTTARRRKPKVLSLKPLVLRTLRGIWLTRGVTQSTTSTSTALQRISMIEAHLMAPLTLHTTHVNREWLLDSLRKRTLVREVLYHLSLRF